jgi:hypothetical protein
MERWGDGMATRVIPRSLRRCAAPGVRQPVLATAAADSLPLSNWREPHRGG